MTTKVPNTLFGLETVRGRLAVVIEADDRPQALRRFRWLASGAPDVLPLLARGAVMRLPPGMPVPGCVPYVSSRTFEDADVD